MSPVYKVLIHVMELLRCRRHTQLGQGGSVPRLILLADVVRDSDGSEYPDDNDDRIVAKLQTWVNSISCCLSPRVASTG